MRRRFARRAEVVRRSRQPRAEQPVPDAVGQHPRRERIVPMHEPFAEFLAAAFAALGDGVSSMGITCKNPRFTGSPRVCTLPRIWICTSPIFCSSSTDMYRGRFGIESCSCFNSRSSASNRFAGSDVSAAVGETESATGFFGRRHVFHRQKLDRIDDDVTFRPGGGDDHEALPVQLEAILPQRHEQIVDRRTLLLIHRHRLLAVGAEHRHRHGVAAVFAGRVSQANFVSPGFRQFRQQGDRLVSLPESWSCR